MQWIGWVPGAQRIPSDKRRSLRQNNNNNDDDMEDDDNDNNNKIKAKKNQNKTPTKARIESTNEADSVEYKRLLENWVNENKNFQTSKPSLVHPTIYLLRTGVTQKVYWALLWDGALARIHPGPRPLPMPLW